MSLLLLFRPQQSAAPVVTAAGGGGFGALMSDEHFHRYKPRYEAGYVSRYKPTIRKQGKR